MVLSIDNQLQERTGGIDGASSVTATLDTGTTAGSALVAIVLGGLDFPVPSGWLEVWSAGSIGPAGATSMARIMFRGPTQGLAAGETSWTFTQTSATSTSWLWWVAEYSNMAATPFTINYFTADTQDGSSGGVSFANLYTQQTPATGTNPWLDTLQVGFMFFRGAVRDATQIRDNAIRIPSNDPNVASFDQFAQMFTGNASGPNWSFALFRRFSNNDAARNNITFATQVDQVAATQNVNDQYSNTVVMLTSADSALLDPIVMCTGFEQGTHHGVTGGLAGSRYADLVTGTHGTSYLVQTGSAKSGTGSYGLRVVASASAARLGWDTNSIGTGLTQAVVGFHVRPVSATTNPAVLAEINAAAAASLVQVVYNPTTSKIGVRFGSGGTVAYQSGTTTINSDYPWIDVLVSGYGGTSRTIKWQIEENGVMVPQTAPANLTGQTATTWLSFTCGSTTTQTVTADFDNVCLSNALADYPLQRHKVVLLSVDPVAAVDVSGVNAWTIANNAAGAAITPGTGLTALAAALDEVPPDFSATADGWCFNAATPSTTVTTYMSTYTVTSPTERIDSVRVVMPMWKNASQASTFTLTGRDSSITAANLGAYPIGQSNTTTGSATTPVWVCKNWSQTSGWTQAKLDAARLEFTSSDGSPPLGPLAVYFEVAICTDASTIPAPLPDITPRIAGSLGSFDRGQPSIF